MLSKTEKRGEEKKIWKLMEGLGSETVHQAQKMKWAFFFLISALEKKNQHIKDFLGTYYLTLPEKKKKDTERQKKGQSNLQMLLFKPCH